MVNDDLLAALLRIEVAFSPRAGVVDIQQLRLPPGRTVADALARGGLLEQAGAEGHSLSVWGKRCGPAQALRDGDRVEVCRPLRVDPMDARRERERAQAGGRQRGGGGKTGPARSPASDTRR